MTEQIIIATLGAAAAYLSQHPKQSWQRWACIVGLLVAPFWIHATYIADQWGMFAASWLFAAAWVRGVRTYWVQDWKPQ